MIDPDKLVERVRELTEHDEDHELRRKDRPPRSRAQGERVERDPDAPDTTPLTERAREENR